MLSALVSREDGGRGPLWKAGARRQFAESRLSRLDLWTPDRAGGTIEQIDICGYFTVLKILQLEKVFEEV